MGIESEVGVKKHHLDFPLMPNFEERQEEKFPALLPVSCAGLNKLCAYIPFGFVILCSSLHLQCEAFHLFQISQIQLGKP